METRHHMITSTSKTFTPRRWQTKALEVFTDWRTQRQSGDSRTFTAAITGGAGKTHIGAMIAKQLISKWEIENLIIICPSNTIAEQWITTFAIHNLDLFAWKPDIKTDKIFDGVLTYHMLNNHPGRINRYIDLKTLIIFDECHHLADSLSWGDASKLAAKNAGYRLMLTGTPFREDEAKIPFVTYKNGELVTNYEYTYGQALQDNYVRPIFFRALDADSHWQLDHNLTNKRLLEDDMSQLDTSRTLNTALDPSSKWFQSIIEMAHQQLVTIRRQQPDAGAIITCRDQSHAKAVQRKIQQITKTNPILAISEDTDSDNKIDEFRTSTDEWLVVVRKGSEGLDIPRLQIGVWATNITKQLSFLQFVWRIVRYRDGAANNEKAYFYMPAHESLINFANSIRDMRSHILNEETHEDAITRELSKLNPERYKPVDAQAGNITEISMTNHPDDLLNLVIRIRELSAFAIDDYARTQGEISLNAALHDIRSLLAVPVTIAQSKPNNSPIDEYEIKRQWKAFKSLFDEIQNGKDWWKDVLSYFYNQHITDSIHADILAERLNMPRSRFIDNWKRDIGTLVDTGLISTRKIGRNRVYKDCIIDKLYTIAPDIDTDELVSALLNQKLLGGINNAD